MSDMSAFVNPLEVFFQRPNVEGQHRDTTASEDPLGIFFTRPIAKAQHHAPKGSVGQDGKHNGGQFVSDHGFMIDKGPGGGGGGNDLRNHVLHMPDAIFDFFDRRPNPIKADCIFLQAKHPEMFSTPENVRAALDWTFTRPDLAYPAHGPEGYFSVVRKGENNHHAVVDLRDEQGQYRVRHVTLIPDDQLAQHLGNADKVWNRKA